MIAACPQCGARYRIERERLPAQGARLRCSRCEAIFRVGPPRVEAAPEPAAHAASQPAAPAATAREAPPTRRLVLVADPDIEAGKALAAALAASGAEPVLVHDGVEAILTIQRMLPSLVVLEASLPKMFGFQVCELMKRNEQLRAIPVVLVGSIHHRERYRRQAAETYGADAYLERPGLAESLVAMLRRDGIAAGPPPAARAAAPPEPAATTPPVPAAPARPAAVAPPAPAPPAAKAPPAPAPPAAVARPAPAPPAPAAPAPAADPALAADLARAERLARIIVSDIVLYNPERFEAALRSGDVVAAMATEMEEGRAHFRERIAERIRERKDFLGEELVRVAKLRGME